MTTDGDSVRIRAEGMLLFTTLLWGGTFTVTKIGLGRVDPFTLLTWRFAAAFILFSVIFSGRMRRIDGKGLLRGTILGLLMFLGYGLQTMGLELTSVAKSSLFTYTFALYVPPLQVLLTGKRISGGSLFGLGIVIGGILLFTSPKVDGINTGDLLTLVSAMAFGVQIVLLDRFSRESDPAALTAVQFLVIALLSWAGSAARHEAAAAWSPPFLWSIAYLSVLGSVAAIYFMNRFQRDTTPTKAVIIYAMEPVFSVLVAAVVLSETLGLNEIAGGCLIITGVIVSELRREIGASRSRRSAR